MRYSFVTRNPGSSRLIAIFAGWAMDCNPFSSLIKNGYDIVVFYDYSHETENSAAIFDEIIKNYSDTSVIAWSFGVAIANTLLSNRISTAIAVNGTPATVDNRYGIPRHVYAITLRSLNRENLLKFYQNVYGGQLPADCMLPDRNMDNLKEELKLMGSITDTNPSQFWTKAYIGQRDAIIPVDNQKNAWSVIQNRPVMVDWPHFPDFQTIINNDIIDKQVIARRFSDSFHEYEHEAVIQRNVAVKLYEMWKKHQNPRGKRILEIGIGTGFLTRKYTTDVISTDSIAIDLADEKVVRNILDEADIAYDGNIISCDAESFVAHCDAESFDTIASASTIQWFNRLEEFFSHVSRILKPGGTGVFSTFEEGTFEEIKAISGRTLSYPTLERLSAMLPDNLEITETLRENHIVKFDNGRQLLRHIQATGVNAVGTPTSYSDTRKILGQLDRNPQLTYKPLYFILKKRT